MGRLRSPYDPSLLIKNHTQTANTSSHTSNRSTSTYSHKTTLTHTHTRTLTQTHAHTHAQTHTYTGLAKTI